MLSNEPQDKFDIYNSVIQGDPDDQDNSDDDDEEVKYLKKKIKKLQQQLHDLRIEIKMHLKIKELADQDKEKLES